MALAYDKYYQTEDLFGDPYPELMAFFSNYPRRGKVLDLGCGQGRDAIPIARLGYEVLGIDNSKVGIYQMNEVGQKEKLNLKAEVADIFKFKDYHDIDFVLFDSMFHFLKKDREKETSLIKTVLKKVKNGCLIIVCIQDSGNKVKILNETLDCEGKLERLSPLNFKYKWKDKESGHESTSNYQLIIVKK